MNKPSKGKIKVTIDGPYEVTGGVPLSGQDIQIDEEGQCHGWKESEKYPAQATYRLCRCGHSKKKPFCDGTHLETGFDGTETAANVPFVEQAEKIEGPYLTLLDAEELCASARFCHRAGGTWDLTERSDDPEAKAAAIEESGDCPSGRLVVLDTNGKAIEPAFEPSIGLVNDVPAKKVGPIWVRGGIPIEAADGETYERRNRVTLCRCGKSTNKPFCDGNHMD